MIKKLLIFFSLILFTSCAQPMGGAEDITDIQPNPQRPSDESVEGGLWFHFDKAEEFIKTSGKPSFLIILLKFFSKVFNLEQSNLSYFTFF